MSRSGYSDECDGWDLIRWRGAVASAIRGKRGQAMLRELVAALDAMPEKRLAATELVTDEGDYCALGVLGRARGMDIESIDPEDHEAVADAFGIAHALACEVMFKNDEAVQEWKYVDVEICGPMRPNYPDWGRHTHSVRVPDESAAARRWAYMRQWAARAMREMK